MNAIGLIPARGGSKGIPDKNLISLRGRPLIAWTIEVANLTKSLDSVYVSTDSPRIAEISLALGANIIERPMEYALDTSPMSAVIQHALGEIGTLTDLVLLEPTSPLRYPHEVEDVLFLLAENRQAVVATAHPSVEHPELMYSLGQDKELTSIWNGASTSRRQDRCEVVTLNGLIYAMAADLARKSPELRHHPMRVLVTDVERSISIDSDADLARVGRWLMSNPEFPHRDD